MENKIIEKDNLYTDIKILLDTARTNVAKVINSTMVFAYYDIGKRIVEEEQNGKERAEYGKFLIKELSQKLNLEYGKGFDERELRKIRQFYLTFQIRDSLSPTLSWTHYRILLRVLNVEAREYYIKEASENNWSVRVLERNISTLYYERLLLSHNKKPVEDEMNEKIDDKKNNALEFIKNPYVLEFLDIKEISSYKEKDLEQALIDNIQKFLLELGKGFAFVSRQKLVRTETSDFYIDLIFYNYILKCFVLVELKTTKMNHQDIGQLDMYVKIFDDLERAKDDNPTIGILLCTETDGVIAKYSVLNNSEQLFASKYKIILPTIEELKKEIEKQKEFYLLVNESEN